MVPDCTGPYRKGWGNVCTSKAFSPNQYIKVLEQLDVFETLR